MGIYEQTRINGSEFWQSFPSLTGARIVAGMALAYSGLTAGAETLQPANAVDTSIVGLADGPRGWNPRGQYDHTFFNELITVVQKRFNALVIPNGAAINIDAGDFLEVADVGSATSVRSGLLEEAGSAAGTVRTATTVAQAEKAVTMGAHAYKVPASSVAIGDEHIDMTAGDIALMDLTDGDLILMEDINGAIQVNKVASVTATVINLVMPSTIVLTYTDNDLVTKIFQVKARSVFQ